MRSTGGSAQVVILDVDGVVSPVGADSTPWGDDVVAGDVFGPVMVSPTLCARLDALSQAQDVTCVWLSSWSSDMRSNMHRFPGRDWPVVADPAVASAPEGRWWKLDAVEMWLACHPVVKGLAWCDDDLRDDRLGAVRRSMRTRGLKPLLLTPRTEVGLTPEDMDRLDAWAGLRP